jgi:hypothetical protein
MVLFSIEYCLIVSCTRGIMLNYPTFTGRSPESVKLILSPVAEFLANYIAGANLLSGRMRQVSGKNSNEVGYWLNWQPAFQTKWTTNSSEREGNDSICVSTYLA